MTEQTGLVPAQETGITLGQQQLDAGDLILPRIKIVQAMSDEAGDKRAQPGDWFNTLTGENLGTELQVLPIITFKQRILLVRKERRADIEEALGADLSEGDGLKCRSFDMIHGIGEPGIECATCPLSEWRDGNRPPLCSETYNVAALNLDGDLIILSFSKSSAKTGKKLFSMLRLQSGAPWRRVYKATTRQEKNDLGQFYVPDVVVDSAADVPAPELMAVAERWNKELGGRTAIDVTPDEELEPEEAPRGKDF